MRFSTPHLQMVFAEDNKFEAFQNTATDLLFGAEMYSETAQRTISKKEAEEKVRSVVFQILGITENSTKKDRKRAMKLHGVELYEVIEEIVDVYLASGFNENEFFNQFVEMRNVKEGDSQEFWTDDKTVLAVAKVSGDHHDISIQNLGEGESYTVKTSTYAVKIGTDLDLYLLGRMDWTKLIEKIAQAFTAHIQNEMYAEVMTVGDKIPMPDQFNKGGALSEATKEKFDTLLEDVAVANDNVPIYIMGTKTALKKLNALADVDWATDSQKSDMSTLGRLGSYEGVVLIEIPQRFALNDTSKKLVDSTKLLIMPQVENKFVKFVDVGETEIVEGGTERGQNQTDLMTYEVQRTMGIATQCGRYFGVWQLA